MKKRLQGMIAGILIGTTIAGSVAIAANTTTLYDVVANGVKIVVDGRRLYPTDANGKTVEPIIYNGTTYLPVRAVANAIDKEVYWDGPNYTVYLGNMDGKLEYPTIEIEDMVSVGQKVQTTQELTDNYGNRYGRAITNWDYNNFKHEFLLNMKYSRFKGVLYIPEGTSNTKMGYLQIIADGKTIYTSPNMTKTSEPVNIDVNVRGYNDVKIEFNYSQNNGALPLCLGDAGFYQ